MQVETTVTLTPEEAQEELNKFARTYINRSNKETVRYKVRPTLMFDKNDMLQNILNTNTYGGIPPKKFMPQE